MTYSPNHRATIGNDFFKDHPEYDVDDLFYEVKTLRDKQARARELLVSTGYIDLQSKAKEVAEMGYMEANKREFNSSHYFRNDVIIEL